jgi:ribosomal protein S18
LKKIYERLDELKKNKSDYKDTATHLGQLTDNARVLQVKITELLNKNITLENYIERYSPLVTLDLLKQCFDNVLVA